MKERDPKILAFAAKLARQSCQVSALVIGFGRRSGR